jgi:hypothetical protein
MKSGSEELKVKGMQQPPGNEMYTLAQSFFMLLKNFERH